MQRAAYSGRRVLLLQKVRVVEMLTKSHKDNETLTTYENLIIIGVAIPTTILIFIFLMGTLLLPDTPIEESNSTIICQSPSEPPLTTLLQCDIIHTYVSTEERVQSLCDELLTYKCAKKQVDGQWLFIAHNYGKIIDYIDGSYYLNATRTVGNSVIFKIDETWSPSQFSTSGGRMTGMSWYPVNL
jgi:hypothetical protein